MYFGGMLMLIGMTTVFTILALVVLGGKLTIAFTNRIKVEEAVVPVRSTSGSGDSRAIAAITAAVETVTSGRGKIEEIRKIK